VSLDLLSLLIAGAGAGWGYLSLRRYSRTRNGIAELEGSFDEDAAVVFSVTMHAMKSRGHSRLDPVHFLYGLVQDETFSGAVKQLGGDPDAVETALLAKLDELKPGEDDMRAAVGVLTYTYGLAKANDRKITICDLWAALARTPQGTLAGVDKLDLLFLLEHGMPQPAPELPGRTDAQIVLRNDHHTTFELVMEILVDVFAFSADDAKALALEVHKNGHATVGRYKVPVARDKLIAARGRAREKSSPLWIALEDV